MEGLHRLRRGFLYLGGTRLGIGRRTPDGQLCRIRPWAGLPELVGGRSWWYGYGLSNWDKDHVRED